MLNRILPPHPLLPRRFWPAFVLLLLACGLFSPVLALPSVATTTSTPLVIAHRGASAYLPEHTLEAKALAYGMRPDYIEQDLVLSKDGHLIVMHDIYLDQITDVAERFPGRAREDGRFYTIDFTLPELKQLCVTEAFERNGSELTQKHPGRFPLWKSSFQLATFNEEIELIQGLNQSLGYDIGIYPEIKKPWFHHREKRDIAKRTLEVLQQYGYRDRQQKVYLQSFDAEELQRIDRELMPQMNMDIPLVQLIAETSWGEKKVEHDGILSNYRYDWMHTPEGLKKISGYADAIGPSAMMLAQLGITGLTASPLHRHAKKLGLPIHAYTFRADSLPKAIRGLLSFEDILSLFSGPLAIDGFFTDNPDRVRAFLDARSSESQSQSKSQRQPQSQPQSQSPHPAP
ncbi:glycerophosphodiester phosphodiesterase, periplasmic [Microbulbifer aestuariivivens]|uniref:glycerophosphodiester phosphodiesterase n=1 Tax=Microbulbifer aestuariivivens TaxID=1908308 RepID=A0ABP9WLW6_9GAMM